MRRATADLTWWGRGARTRCVVAALALMACVAPTVASARVRGAAAAPQAAAPQAVAPETAAPQAALADVDAQLAFLGTAKVVSSRPIGKGVTGAKRVTLSNGTRTHDAAFQAVAKESLEQDLRRGRRRGGETLVVDHYRYNIAAWRLAHRLGLGYMMPATVERAIGGHPGALSWWVDDVLMDEEERQKTSARPPGGSIELSRQFGRMYVFAELVRDTDRNMGNVVFTTDWRLVMLDFTRAFRLQPQLLSPTTLGAIDRRLLVAMRALTADQVKAAVDAYLTAGEIGALMARRELLVAHFDRLIAERGAAAVLY